jgi:hypothetical protein
MASPSNGWSTSLRSNTTDAEEPPRRQELCCGEGMAISAQLKRYAGRRITRRLMRSMPWIGGVIALATVGRAIRQKGVLGGTVDTTLDFIPFVGAVKNLAEAVRGRDFIPERSTTPRI